MNFGLQNGILVIVRTLDWNTLNHEGVIDMNENILLDIAKDWQKEQAKAAQNRKQSKKS